MKTNRIILSVTRFAAVIAFAAMLHPTRSEAAGRGGPPDPVPGFAAMLYLADFGHTRVELEHTVPGDCDLSGPLGLRITWKAGTASIGSLQFSEFHLWCNKDATGRLISVSLGAYNKVTRRWYSTDDYPILNGPVTIDNVHGYILQLRADNIPLWRHSGKDYTTPREVVPAASMAFGDVVIAP